MEVDLIQIRNLKTYIFQGKGLLSKWFGQGLRIVHAVDGVSLTVDEGPFTDRFTVNLIPHTLQETTFESARTGRRVNLEMDVLVKAARTGSGWPGIDNSNKTPGATKPSGLTLERLLTKGFGRLGSKGRS